jgi:hypothetical protein
MNAAKRSSSGSFARAGSAAYQSVRAMTASISARMRATSARPVSWISFAAIGVVVWTRSWCAYHAAPSFMSLAPIDSRHLGRYSVMKNASNSVSAVSIGSSARAKPASRRARSSAAIDFGIAANGRRSVSRRPARAARTWSGTCSTVTFGGTTPASRPARITSMVPSTEPGTPCRRFTYAS